MSTKKQPTPAETRKARIWLALSCLLTIVIMVWAFSLPFRSDALTFAEQSDGEESTTGSAGGGLFHDEEAKFRADQFRAAAIALDQEFMQRRREKNQPRNLPGKEQVNQYWDGHVQHVQRELQQIGEPQRGSLEWQEQQELLKSLDDAPL